MLVTFCFLLVAPQVVLRDCLLLQLKSQSARGTSNHPDFTDKLYIPSRLVFVLRSHAFASCVNQGKEGCK